MIDGVFEGFGVRFPRDVERVFAEHIGEPFHGALQVEKMQVQHLMDDGVLLVVEGKGRPVPGEKERGVLAAIDGAMLASYSFSHGFPEMWTAQFCNPKPSLI